MKIFYLFALLFFSIITLDAQVFTATHHDTSSQKITENVSDLKINNLRGYLSHSDIDELLEQSGSVGLRIYNIHHDQRGAFIIACAVGADGFDFKENYLKCQIQDSTAISTGLGGRNSAESEIKGLAPNSNKFTSFFSKQMIEMLKEGNDERGVAFYFGQISGRNTHIGVPASLNDGVVVSKNSAGSQRVVSDLPCPNHCVSVSRFSSGKVAGVRISSVPLDPGGFNTSPPYIRFWQ